MQGNYHRQQNYDSGRLMDQSNRMPSNNNQMNNPNAYTNLQQPSDRQIPGHQNGQAQKVNPYSLKAGQTTNMGNAAGNPAISNSPFGVAGNVQSYQKEGFIGNAMQGSMNGGAVAPSNEMMNMSISKPNMVANTTFGGGPPQSGVNNSAINQSQGNYFQQNQNMGAGVRGGVNYSAAQPFSTANQNSLQNSGTSDALIQEIQNLNAPSYFVRTTVSRVPSSASLKQKAHIPIGVMVRPLATPPAGYPSVPSVNFGSSGVVVRCKRCRTYINPYVQWEANGRRWVCNICAYGNDTPSFYYCNLDESGKRLDRYERPELSMGSVEFIAPGDYMVRPPQPPVFMIVLDVSLTAVSSGLVESVCQGIKDTLQSGRIPGGSRTLLGVITFDSTIHFYRLSSSISQSQMLVVSDLSDLFLPLPDDILVSSQDSRQVIENLLDNLPQMWRNTKITDNCMGSAVKAAYMAMKHIGGKILLFTSGSPSIGDLVVKPNRESSKMPSNIDREVELLRPVNDNYLSFAQLMARSQIGLDLFVCTSQYIDLPTIAPLAKNSSGDIHYYPGFNSQLHGSKLMMNIDNLLTRLCGWEAVMRFRVSRGWRITNWFGNFYFNGVDLLLVPNCNGDHTYSILLDMEENVTQDPCVYLQSALLYTNSDGERRIRVHTYCLPVTQNYLELAHSMDTSVTASMLCQQAIEISLGGKLLDGRNYIQTICSQILAPQANQLSETAAALPLFCLGILKSPAFRDSKDSSSDMRIYHWCRLASLRLDSQMAFFYPKMYCLTSWDHKSNVVDNTQTFETPPALSLTSEQMTQGGAYLVEDGETMMLWLGRAVPTSFVQDVFGVSSLDQLHPDYAETVIGTTGSPLGLRIAALVNNIRQERNPPYMKLFVIRQGDPLEHRFFMSLIEDRTQGMMVTYNEFMAKMMPRSGNVMSATIGAAQTAAALPAVLPTGHYKPPRAQY